MSKILELPQIKKAGPMARLEIVNEILESIGDLEITDEFRSELERRRGQLIKNPNSGRSWSQVKLGRRK